MLLNRVWFSRSSALNRVYNFHLVSLAECLFGLGRLKEHEGWVRVNFWIFAVLITYVSPYVNVLNLPNNFRMTFLAS